MLTCKSPRKILRKAYDFACRAWPEYSSKYSRKDYTQPQLFACLSIKELYHCSYRTAEELLRDSDSWLRDIGLKSCPDHNTLQRAAQRLLRNHHVQKILDAMATEAMLRRILGLSSKPLAIDSTTYESHHVSRHYERRCKETRRKMRQKDRKKGYSRSRAQTVRRLPKLAIAVASGCHLILGYWTGTGAGADHPHQPPLLEQVRARVPHRRIKVVADAGYDSEAGHERIRSYGWGSVIPPEHGRPRKDGGAPGGYWRSRMPRHMASLESRRKCSYTQRSQDETVNSMMKRNLSSALRGKDAWSRKRDMALKVLVHNTMLLKPRVETEPL
jgi:hypothetical protein